MTSETKSWTRPGITDADDPVKRAGEAAAAIRQRSGVDTHDIAVVLGSGWGEANDLLGDVVAEFEANELPGFVRPGVVGHTGIIRSVRLQASGKHALVVGARNHLYEGRGVRSVVHGVRTAAAAGCSTLVLTNGSGGLNDQWEPGTPVLISDHINLTATSPLEGATFVDLTDLYAPRLRDLARQVDPDLPEGVYVQFPGPHYETPAEVQFVKRIGGDLVGMSTVLEAIAARAEGMEILGISLVTNHAAGIAATPLNHADVVAAGAAAAPRIGRMLADVIGRI